MHFFFFYGQDISPSPLCSPLVHKFSWGSHEVRTLFFSFIHSTSMRLKKGSSRRIGLVYWRCLLQIKLQRLRKESPSFKGLGYTQFSRFSSQKIATLKKLTATISFDRISRSLCWGQNQICYCLCTYGAAILTGNIRFSSCVYSYC